MEEDSRAAACAFCGADLPRGVRVGLYASTESEDALLGDFCCVAHAFTALDSIAQTGTVVPETLFLGVKIDRGSHDETALASIMAEIARRAVRAAMENGETISAAPPPPPSMLN